MSPETASLDRLYEAFNARSLDAALAAMHPDVKWPNGWEGGYVAGREGVREYWTRQWAEIDSAATPTEYKELPDGRLEVVVRVRATKQDGSLLWDNIVTHTYTFQSGLIRSMEIGRPD